MNNIMVSIIIPIYNVESYLNQCVDSVLNQTYKNIEVILVDDGSQDCCPSICDGYVKKDKRIKVIHKKNGGVSSAREAGMKVVTGDYVMFVDGDDWLELNTIEECISEVKKDSDIGCVLFSYIKETSNFSISMHIMNETMHLKNAVAEDKVYRRLFGLLDQELHYPERMENIVPCCMKFYRVDYAKKGKYFDTKLIGSCEDGLFNIYALYECNNIVYLDRNFYHYRKQKGTLTESYRPNLVQQWELLFDIMGNIIHEKNLSQEYNEALLNRIALSITAIGLNEFKNPVAGTKEHIKIIHNYLEREQYRYAVRKLKIANMPFPWKILMISCKLKCSVIVYFILSAINRIMRR